MLRHYCGYLLKFLGFAAEISAQQNVVIACGIGTGTASEIALALKANKKVILLNSDESSKVFFQRLSQLNVFVVNNVVDAIEQTRKILLTAK